MKGLQKDWTPSTGRISFPGNVKNKEMGEQSKYIGLVVPIQWIGSIRSNAQIHLLVTIKCQQNELGVDTFFKKIKQADKDEIISCHCSDQCGFIGIVTSYDMCWSKTQLVRL